MRRASAEQGALLVAAGIAAVATSDSGQWDDEWLIAVLLVIGVGAELLTTRLGTLRISAGGLIPILSAALAGPAPAFAIAIVSMLADAVRHRPPLAAVVTNMATHGTVGVLAGVTLDALREAGTVVPGEVSWPLAITGVALLGWFLNYALTIHAMALAGYPWRATFRQAVIPTAPWETLLVGLAAGTAHAHVDLGLVAVVAFGILLLVVRLVLVGVIQAEERGRELTRVAADRDRYMEEVLRVEERERQRVAAELHDDALQQLLAAREDLVDGLAGDDDRLRSAQAAIGETVSKLRDLMVRLHPPEPPAEHIAPALELTVESLRRRAGVEGRVVIDRGVREVRDPLMLSIARELLVNVVKHARATMFEVRLSAEGDELVLDVLDDGVGFELEDASELIASGHLGLALVQQRIETRGGRLAVAPRDGGGTHARVILPAANGYGDGRATRPDAAHSARRP